MISLFIIIFIITLLAFAFTVPLNGYLTEKLIMHGAYDKQYVHERMVADWLEYFDILGTFSLFFLGFGWGTILSVEPVYITGVHKTLRTILAYSAQALASIAIAVCAIMISVLLTGKGCILTAFDMFFVNSRYVGTDATWQIFQRGSAYFSSCSPYAITATLFFIGIVYVQTGILFLSMMRNTIQALLYPFRSRLIALNYSWLFMIAIPLIFCILFYKFFFVLAISFIIFFINSISSLLHGV